MTAANTTITIGGKEHSLRPMCLRTSRMAMSRVPLAYRSRDPDVLFQVFIDLVEDGLRTDDDEETVTLSARTINRTLLGTEVPGMFLSIQEWMGKSGFESKGELSPMDAGITAMMMQMPSSTASSSPSDERALEPGEISSDSGPSLDTTLSSGTSESAGGVSTE